MRKSGILMHISSLPSDYGIGTMGKEAYKFVQNKSVGRFCRLARQATAIRRISRSQRMQAIRIL